jgi:polysaccharide export outer membrane protein
MEILTSNAGTALANSSFKLTRPVAACLLSLLLAGCSTFIPRGGPSVSMIEDEGNKPDASFPYKLVQITPVTAAVLQTDVEPTASAAGFFSSQGARDLTLGAGDVLSITIVEPASGGLFSGLSTTGSDQGAKVVTLPDAQIDRLGWVVIPFAGKVMAAGRTLTELAHSVEFSLKGTILQPQVSVRLSLNLHNKAIVTGIARTPGALDLSPARETLLQLIVKAGGPAQQSSDVVIELTRGGSTRKIRLQKLLDNPSLDIAIEPGDFINLVFEPRVYSILGAAGKVGEFPLPTSALTLGSAISRSGGEDDLRANRTGVFLLRYEPSTIAAQVASGVDPAANAVPVVYQLDNGHASGFFLSQQIPLHDKDIVYVGNAGLVEWQKALQLLRLTTTPFLQATAAGNALGQ